nr:C1 family peptidase [Caballeronia sp. GACF5]
MLNLAMFKSAHRRSSFVYSESNVTEFLPHADRLQLPILFSGRRCNVTGIEEIIQSFEAIPLRSYRIMAKPIHPRKPAPAGRKEVVLKAARTTKKPRKAINARVPRQRPVTPDQLDFRDRVYQPPVSLQPAKSMFPRIWLSIKNQEQTNACTGFALSTVIEYLLLKGQREERPSISPFMLYSMARRYDEIPEPRNADYKLSDTGSTLRGALKGWYKQGSCASRLWPNLDMPEATNKVATDWWIDAVKRPLGAYYRVDPLSISDMHVAINDLGVLYASAVCHGGWEAENSAARRRIPPKKWSDFWHIPCRKADNTDGGHAFAIVGYNEDGFLIHNSWGTDWGTAGYAILTYSDWQLNAMDCWAPQIGVVTVEHRAIAAATTLRTQKTGSVVLATSEVLANREIAPFILDVGNNGELNSTGDFRTGQDDVLALTDYHVGEARKRWGLGPDDPIDIAIYAHGGLVAEAGAANAARKWLPILYSNRIFPIFIMWETGFFDTIVDRIEDAAHHVPPSTGAARGFLDSVRRFLNQRIERALSAPGTILWNEMKQNADALSGGTQDAGLRMLYEAFTASKSLGRFRLHLIGHSAGAIVHGFVVDRLAALGLSFSSMSMMAPAARVDTFQNRVLPHLNTGTVDRYLQFSLTDDAEERDLTCKPYLRSLLYLVSESFEAGVRTPILGMDRHFQSSGFAGHARVTYFTTPSDLSPNATHGGFDDDPAVQKTVVEFVHASQSKAQSLPVAPAGLQAVA